jgi:diguanylate cyclase (GGDEF)-like protein
VVVRSSHLRLLAGEDALGDSTLVESYRRLADVFHEVLAEQTLDTLLVRIADVVGDLIPHDTLTIYEADEAEGVLKPVLVVRDPYADEIMSSSLSFAEGEGLTGWAVSRREAVLANQAHNDPRVRTVPGTPIEPESLICIPLIARGHVKGALNIYRDGENVHFSDTEFELAKRFGDAAALALDNAEIRARLEHQARTDSLTGLFNHSVFYEQLLHALQEASRAHSSVAVLMLDIDDFKHVNDVHGHAVGDELLRFLAEALRATVRPEDIVCRLGGEEFAVVMVGCAEDDAVKVAERIKHRLGDTEFPGIGRLRVSVGLALGPEHAMNPRELAACAEAAMMTAKAQGKNQIVLYCDDGGTRRPDAPAAVRDVRSIAHLKMLQSLSGKLNRSNDVKEIGEEIVAELKSLIDYHNCRVFVRHGDELVPVAFLGEFSTSQVALSLDVLRIKVGAGITGRCAELGEAIVVGDAANCEFGRQLEGTDPIEESLLAVPLRYGSRVVGVIVVSKLGLNQFDEDEVRLLEVLAGHAAVAVENARLYESARREAESATALLEFGRELATLVELDDIVERVTSLSAAILGSEFTSFWLERDGKLRLLAEHGHTPEWAARLRAYAFPIGSVPVDREPYISEPRDHGELVAETPAGPEGRYAVAPFSVGGRAGCIVAVVSDQDFGERELRLLGGLAHQAQLAIANASSYEGLERTFVSTVEALANALEANDEYTSTHARWISDLALRVGRELGLDERTLKRLELGALLHDIGKIGIPSDILSKPGRLTAQERRIVQTHPELGERIIAPIDRLQTVRPIVRHCHERWDGRGYPDGIGGEEIPLESRIIFVCDAYHAMTTDRPYRHRLSHREALRRLADGAGTQFDPTVVEVALEVLEQHRNEIALSVAGTTS